MSTDCQHEVTVDRLLAKLDDALVAAKVATDPATQLRHRADALAASEDLMARGFDVGPW